MDRTREVQACNMSNIIVLFFDLPNKWKKDPWVVSGPSSPLLLGDPAVIFILLAGGGLGDGRAFWLAGMGRRCLLFTAASQYVHFFILLLVVFFFLVFFLVILIFIFVVVVRLRSVSFFLSLLCLWLVEVVGVAILRFSRVVFGTGTALGTRRGGKGGQRYRDDGKPIVLQEDWNDLL
ncbi:hypothetical protein E2C01_010085 [Portunus trituberculatus]|uniref:Transmembrane protein n=1 Tax=Portunus trituberculatus TaxID=210409 RepID=A0A5B7D7R4_PORTR|nr:hypothetical protein [Portunus trituberculatus]